jgi:hypothetical protein
MRHYLKRKEWRLLRRPGRLIVKTPVENDKVDSSVSFEDENGSLHMVEPVCSPEEETGTLSILYKASDSTFVAFYRP